MRRKGSGDWRIRGEIAARQFQSLLVGVIGVPGKDHRLEVQCAKLLIVQPRSFVRGSQVVARAFRSDQQRRHSCFAGSENAQFDCAAGEPCDVLVALDQDAVKVLAV